MLATNYALYVFRWFCIYFGQFFCKKCFWQVLKQFSVICEGVLLGEPLRQLLDRSGILWSSTRATPNTKCKSRPKLKNFSLLYQHGNITVHNYKFKYSADLHNVKHFMNTILNTICIYEYGLKTKQNKESVLISIKRIFHSWNFASLFRTKFYIIIQTFGFSYLGFHFKLSARLY